jgi:hypothetical protein
MNKPKLHCPTCKGSGKQNITFHSSEGINISLITCIDCNGNDLTNEQVLEIIKFKDYQNSIWCSCGNKHGVHYYEDGEGKLCYKHHYVCNDCKLIVQIG